MIDLNLPTARDWMIPSPFVLSPEIDLFDALDLLVKYGVAAAPVVDRQHHLLGMLTEKDCLRVLSNVAYDGDLKGGTVEGYMSKVRVICEPQMDLFRAAEMFLATNFPILPVVESGRLIGLISRQNMLRGIQELRRRLDRRRQALEDTAGRQADRPRSIESLQRAAGSQTRDQLVRLFGRRG